MSKVLQTHMPASYKGTARMIGYALLLDTPADWQAFSLFISARLNARQRSALALMALRSLDPDQAFLVADTALSPPAMEVAA
ncbi:MAG: hypothetical protein AAF340_17945 [Pseudomonadota bacterium]